jgi:type III secretory pathway component EscV
MINLLETMPQRIMIELEKREELKKALRMKQAQEDLDFQIEHMHQLNRLMYGVDTPKIKIEANDPKNQNMADQFTELYNHIYVGKEGKKWISQ